MYEVRKYLLGDCDLMIRQSLCSFILQILKSPPVRFDPKSLCVPAYSGTVLDLVLNPYYIIFDQCTI